MEIKKQSITKKQHYVPRMYLRNFCIEGEKDKCFEYNPNTKSVRITNINNLCEERYLYEIRNEEGDFLVPDLKNQIEKALSIVETQDAEFLRFLLEEIEQSNDFIVLNDEQIKSLFSFIFLMILRNPAFKDALPETLKYINGTELKTKTEIKIAWIYILLNVDYSDEIENTQITFLKTKESNPFITSELPMFFSGYPIQRDFYMPLSSKVAVEMSIATNEHYDKNMCVIRDLSIEDVDYYNCKVLNLEGSIISSSREALDKCVSYINYPDISPINLLTSANLEMFGNMQPEYFHLMMKIFVDEELANNNETFVDTFNRLIKDISADEAKNKMAIAIEEEFRKALACESLLDAEDYKELFAKIR